MNNLFLTDKPCQIVLALNKKSKPKYASSLIKEVDCTYTHLTKVVSKLIKEGFVKKYKTDRRQILMLTPTGEAVADSIYELNLLLKS